MALPTDRALQVTGLITDTDGTPTRQEAAEAIDGVATLDPELDPVRIAS